MRIVHNGEMVDVMADNLTAILLELGYADTIVATALNGIFVAAPLRLQTSVGEGDRIEVLAPMQGG